MIVLLILLWSLCAIYFAHLLSVKKMNIAAIAIIVLYTYVIAWIYAIFIIDVADLGFSDTESIISLLHGSEIYHSFVNITDKMSGIPFELLEAIAVVAVIVLVSGLAVAIHGFFEITKAVICATKKMAAKKAKDLFCKVQNKPLHIFSGEIIRLNCRMNC